MRSFQSLVVSFQWEVGEEIRNSKLELGILRFF
jgi:hypothetical protein